MIGNSHIYVFDFAYTMTHSSWQIRRIKFCNLCVSLRKYSQIQVPKNKT